MTTNIGSMSKGSSVAFELPPSVWELIKNLCPEKESNELKRMLGQSLIEEACDLLTEANLLLDIWRHMREDIDPGEPHDRDIPFTLHEPPGVRDRLVYEIRFLLEHLHQRDSYSFSRSSPLSQSVLDYVICDQAHQRSRPNSAVSKDGRETPLRETPTSNISSSSLSDITGCTFTQTISVTDIGNVVRHLRESLREECEQRRNDIAFLQTCIDEEIDYQSKKINTPSIKELQTVSRQLEQEILRCDVINQSCCDYIHKGTQSHMGVSISLPIPTPPTTTTQNTRPSLNINRASRVKRLSAPATTTSFPPLLPFNCSTSTSSPVTFSQNELSHYSMDIPNSSILFTNNT